MARSRWFFPAVLSLFLFYVLLNGFGRGSSPATHPHQDLDGIHPPPANLADNGKIPLPEPPAHEPPPHEVDFDREPVPKVEDPSAEQRQQHKPPPDAFRIPGSHADDLSEPAHGAADEQEKSSNSQNFQPDDHSSGTKAGSPKHGLDHVTSSAFPSYATPLARPGKGGVGKKPRYAIASSCWDPDYVGMSLMLGWSIRKHNDLAALNADLILLTLKPGPGVRTLSDQDRGRLEKAGWTIRTAEELTFPDVNITEIRARHRHNLNKLHLWSWEEYEKIVFIDSDTACKGYIGDLFKMPGEFAAAPDVWWDILTDTRFNSGVMAFKPNVTVFNDMMKKIPDPTFHRPEDADQAFLQTYYQFRFFGLPYKYNFNLVLYDAHNTTWYKLWDEALILHLTTHKPSPDPKNHCTRKAKCAQWEPLTWYREYYKEMRSELNLANEIPILG